MKKLSPSLLVSCLLVSLLVLAARAEATTYYVDLNVPSGCASTYNPATRTCGSGTFKSFGTIAAGVSGGLVAGDVLDIRAGTYSETIDGNSIVIPSGASWSTPVTIAGHAGEIVTLQHASPNSGALLNIATTSLNPTLKYIILQHLVIDGSNLNNGASNISVNSDGVHVAANHIRFVDVESKFACRLTGAADCNGFLIAGDAADGAGFNEFINVNSHDNGMVAGAGNGSGGYGMYINGSDHLIEGGRFHHNGGYGIQLYKSTASSDRNTIRNNQIYENAQAANAVSGGMISKGDSNKIYGNIFWSTVNKNNLIGLDIYAGSTNTLVANNTVVGFQYFGITTAEGAGAANTTVRNNILHGNGSNGAQFEVSGSGSVASNNLCTSACPTGTSNQTEAATSTFTDSVNHDYTLKSSSLAVNHGVDLSATFTTDLLGNARGQGGTWDIGAYEFSSVAAPTVTVTVPTSSPTYSASSPAIALAGTSSVGVTTVSWTSDRGGSGTASGTTSWAIASGQVTLKPGLNTLTFTATDTNSNFAVATLVVTYIPTFPGNTLAGAWGFEEGSGPTATDSSGNGNTGTLINSPSRVAGRYGQGLQFDGVTQSITISDANTLDFSQSFALSAWVQPTAVHADYRAVIHKDAAPNGLPYGLYASTGGTCGGGSIAGYETSNGILGPTASACNATPLPIGVWSHLAITYDGSNLRLYKNGVLVATTAAAGYMEDSAATLKLGASEYGEFFQGVLDEIRVYNYAIPISAGSNTVPGAACVVASVTPSVIRDMNCQIVTPAPQAPLKLGVGATIKLGTGAVIKLGQ